MKYIALLFTLLLVGCSAVERRVVSAVSGDLTVAITRGEKALGPDDALVVCYKALDQVVKAHQVADELDDGLLLDAIMRARIIEQVRQRVGAELRKACGEITLEVLMTAARRR